MAELHDYEWSGPRWLDINLFYIRQLESFTMTRCPLTQASVWTRVLVFSSYLPLFMTAGYYIVSPVRKEVYIAYVGLCMGIDGLINWGLVNAFAEDSPYPGCSFGEYSTPNPGMEQFAMVYTLITSYYQLTGTPMGVYEKMAMTVMMAFLPVALVRLGYSNTRQVVVAAAFGSCEAVVYQLLGLYVFPRYATPISDLKLFKFFGFTNTMFDEEGNLTATKKYD